MVAEKVATPDQQGAAQDQPSDVYVFPCSLEQSRYWILDQLAGASTASNMAIAFRLEGPVQDRLVAESLRLLVERHEALRTTFRMVEGELSQVISEQPTFSFSVSDVSSLDAAAANTKAEQLVLEHSHVRIDLAAGPVFYARLIHVTPERHFLAFTIHHIACDGWSNGILVRDFTAIYSALADGRTPALPQLPFQFADFTVWQQEWLASPAAETAVDFWRENLGRDMPAVDLPVDHPRSASQHAPGHIESELLSPLLSARLRDYSRRHDATMHQVLLAAFEGLLSRYTGQTRFLLGSTIANRTQPGMEDVVGRFANPQIIPADVDGDPTYRQIVERVVAWSARSYAHQDLPFSRLIEEFEFDQSGATSQFLQVYFVYQKAFMQPQQGGELKVIPRPSVSGGVNFDLLVSVVERAEGPRLQVEYNTLIFEKQRIRRLIQMYLRVLDAVVTDDTLKISEFPLTFPEERAEVEAAGRGRPLEGAILAREDSLPSWLDRWAGSLGNTTALVDGKRRYTWNELRQHSLGVAHVLRQSGVKPGQAVALEIDITADSLAAAMAILRIGAAVLPVPRAREITSAAVAEWNLLLFALHPAYSLARPAIAEKLPTVNNLERVSELARDAAPLDADPYPSPGATAWLNLRTDPDGQYQTEAVSHETALEKLLGAAGNLRLQSGDVAALWPAAGSAEAWTGMMLPLTAGATLMNAGPLSMMELKDAISREQAGFAFAEPAIFLDLAAANWKFDRRMRLVCHAPGLAIENLQRLARFEPAPKVHAFYCSPYAAGVFATAALTSEPGGDGPIGARRSSGSETHRKIRLQVSPLPGRQILLLDKQGESVPFSVPGEVVIGDGRSKPVRTGFDGRYSPESGFEMLGKSSGVVPMHGKRGYRIRLQELETTLYRHGKVTLAEAAVVQDGGTQTLIAFVSGSNGGKPPAEDLRAFLNAEAPAHLAEAEIVAVGSMPRRADGSIQISALPRPDQQNRSNGDSASETVAAPRDEIETSLVAIWEEAFGKKPIGIRTSFFALGGYSLMIVRLFARINKHFNSSLPITTIFNAPTIEQLAGILRGNTSLSPVVPVRPGGVRPPLFLILSYLIYDGMRTVLGEDRPLYGLREIGNEAELSIEERAEIYANEIRSVAPHGPYLLAGWCAAGPMTVETARRLTESGEQVTSLILFDSWRPGYAEELAAAQKGNVQATRTAAIKRKIRYHRMRLAPLSGPKRVHYFWSVIMAKARSQRDKFYLRHWDFAQRILKLFGAPPPDFMFNVTRATLNAAKAYEGRPYPGRITLIRAADAPYIPGAEGPCGWDKIAQEGVDVVFAPGTHESMFLEPNLTVLGQILNQSLEREKNHPGRPANSQSSLR